MAKLNMNFNLPFNSLAGMMHAFKDLEQLNECKDKDELEKKLKDLEAGFETRLKEGFSAFLDPSAFKVDPSVATNGRDKGIAVKEDAAGWLLTAQVPGVSAEQCAITVEDDGEHARLRIYGPRHEGSPATDQRLIADYRKPSHLTDAASVRASCIDGVLQVAVPKVAPTERRIPVVAGDISDADGATKSMTVHVPGYAAADIALTLKLPSRELIVEAHNDHMHHFRSRTLNLPTGVDASEDGGISATCRNGILTVRLAAAPVAERRAVPVSDAFEAADANAGTGDVKVVLEKAVPGLTAADVSVEVDPASRCVNVTTAGAAGARSGAAGARSPGRCMMLVNSLPRGADPATVKAACANGFLRVTAAGPAASAERRVAVSADEPAHM